MNKKFLLQSALIMVVSGASTSVYAQVEDEIIVTATKRAQSVQDIPIAVTAVTPKQLERQGILDIKSLSSVVGGLSIQSSQTESQGTAIRIRGIGTRFVSAVSGLRAIISVLKVRSASLLTECTNPGRA